MATLFELLKKRAVKITAIVGMTKNVGKTVTFNYLVEKYEGAKKTLGLVSAGYDGERFDRLTLKEKPRIYAPGGAFVATARACFEAADAELELIETSTFSTPLGAVCLGRVKQAGLVELAGPGSVSGLKGLIAKMSGYGAENLLVDGAINRLASASPLVSDAVILASGAALGPTMEDVVRKSIFRRDLLLSPQVDNPKLLETAEIGLQKGNAALLHSEENGYSMEILKGTIPLVAGASMIDKCREDTTALVFGGALVDSSLEALLELFDRPPLIIVRDATRLFISPEVYYRFLNRGGMIAVLKKINLIALTLNPTDPCGRGYDPQMFLERMAEVMGDCPVFDLIFEGKNDLHPNGKG